MANRGRRRSEESGVDAPKGSNGVEGETSINLLQWLKYHHREIDSTADILKDEINTLVKRKILPNKAILKEEHRPETVRYGKSIVIGFHDAINKAVRNLQSMQLTMTKELQQRFNLPDEWIETASVMASVAGSEVVGPAFSRKYMEKRIQNFIDDETKGSDTSASDVKSGGEDQEAKSKNEVDPLAIEVVTLPLQNHNDALEEEESNEETLPEVSKLVADNEDPSEIGAPGEEDVDTIPESEDETRSKISDEKQYPSRSPSVTPRKRTSASKSPHSHSKPSSSNQTPSPRTRIKIKQEKLESTRIDKQKESKEEDTAKHLKGAKNKDNADSGSDTDGSGKTCIVPRTSDSSHSPSKVPDLVKVKKEKAERTIGEKTKDDGNGLQSEEACEQEEDTHLLENTGTEEKQNTSQGDIDEFLDALELEPANGEQLVNSSTLLNTSMPEIADPVSGVDIYIDPFDLLSENLLDSEDTRTVVLQPSTPLIEQDKPSSAKKSDKDKVEEPSAGTSGESPKVGRTVIQAEEKRKKVDEENEKPKEKLSRAELAAKKAILNSSSDESNKPTTSARAIKRRQVEKDRTPVKTTTDDSWRLDPKLKEGAAVVAVEKLNPAIEKSLNEDGYVTLKGYDKMRKCRQLDDFVDSDASSVASNDSLAELNLALQKLSKTAVLQTRIYRKKTVQARRRADAKGRKARCSGKMSELESDDLDSDEMHRPGLVGAAGSPTSVISHSGSEDLDQDQEESGEDKKEKRTDKKGVSKEDKKQNGNKKKYVNPMTSSSDSEEEKRKLILGSDSDSDADKKKRTRKSSKKSPHSSDSDVVGRRRKKKIKRESSSDDSSVIALDSDSDSDTDFKNAPPKKSKRRRDSSADKSSKKKKRRRIKNLSDDSDKNGSGDSDIQEVSPDEQEGSSQKGRKNIRKIMSKKELHKSTREAEKEEEERRKRVSERQSLFNGVHEAPTCGKVEQLVLDMDPKTKEPLIKIDESIVHHLKPHQVDGIKFMYNACFESVEMIKENKVPGGCILAHCMGLGKTLQSVAFIHTLLTNELCGIKRALIICPLSTVNNWFLEFKNWTEDAEKQLKIHKLYEAKNNIHSRMDYLRTWERRGGVGILHYDMFRRLVDPKDKSKKIKKEAKEVIRKALLDPGPDIVICDEGHLLKNCKSMLSLAVNSVGTLRRIVLTGTPLQNNLVEYHTMMSFVKPKLLGSLQEFTNRFVNPIKNGQHADSTDYDVKIMKRRSHVLHRKLEGCVQRYDYSILAPYLPPKYEYIIHIKLSEKQELLYKHYLENVVDTDLLAKKRNLLKHYAELVKVWSHPIALTMSRSKDEDDETSEDEDSLKDFIDDDEEVSEVVSESGEGSSDNSKKAAGKRKTRAQAALDPDLPIESNGLPENGIGNKWWSKFFGTKSDMYGVELSGKLIVLQQILKTCESIGDKVLVFSQYLSSLDIIEEFLQDWDKEAEAKTKGKEITFPLSNDDCLGRWRRNIEYFRIDGQTKVTDRHRNCETFNRKSSFSRAKLFLISTRAGGLGINLYGANRVVIFDASWNPSQDMQSIFRVYRFGQDKPCYVYRLIARGTMEEKILRRQITKLSLASRVVDEHQIERHFKFDDVFEMFQYDGDAVDSTDTLAVPKDRLLADLLMSHKDWIRTYEEFDSLLENKLDEGLSNEEKEAAWEEYRQESERQKQFNTNANNNGPQDVETFLKVRQRLIERHPNVNVDHLGTATQISVNVIELIRSLILEQNELPPEHRSRHDTQLEPLKLWLQSALGPALQNTSLVRNPYSPLLPPFPIGIEPYLPIILQRAPTRLTMPARPPIIRRQPQQVYPRQIHPNLQQIHANFNNIAASSLSSAIPGPRPTWNRINLNNTYGGPSASTGQYQPGQRDPLS